jgi:hypothetical protein
MNTPKFMWISLLLSGLLLGQPAFADDAIRGQVQGGGAAIANSIVTLWQAGTGAPKQIAQTKTSGDGRFEIHHKDAANDTILYLIAAGGSAKAKPGSGDNPASFGRILS